MAIRKINSVPEGPKRDRVCDGSSLILSKGVTKLGRIKLDYHSSLILSEGVTQAGGLYALSGSSITFPDGYVLKNPGPGVLDYSAQKMNRLLSEHQKILASKNDKKSRREVKKNFGIKM